VVVKKLNFPPEEAKRIVESFESDGYKSLATSGLKFLSEKLKELGLDDRMRGELMAIGMARYNYRRTMSGIANKLIEVEPMPAGAVVCYDGEPTLDSVHETIMLENFERNYIGINPDLKGLVEEIRPKTAEFTDEERKVFFDILRSEWCLSCGRKHFCRCENDKIEYNFPKPSVSVDFVIFGIDPGKYLEVGNFKVLLIKRKNSRDNWVLPGGFVEMNETIEHAAFRELKEETGIDLYAGNSATLHPWACNLAGVFDVPEGRVISHAFLAVVDINKVNPAVKDNAKDIRWFNVTDISEIAFDHGAIIEMAIAKLDPKFLAKIVLGSR
jgi:ADP-ribose pyrophosphatase YjhB (NUDIX family)